MRWWYAGLVAVSKRRVTFHVFYVFVCDDERTVARHELFSLQSRRGGGLRLTLRQVYTDEGWIRSACCLPVHGRCGGASQSQDQEKKRATA